MRKILIATDGSPAAAEAVNVGVELAAGQDAQVTFVHVMPAVDLLPAMNVGYGLPGFHMAFGLVGAIPHVATRHDRAPLEAAAAVAATHDVNVESALLAGATVSEIVAYGNHLDADLIVVGSRAHNGVVPTFLGSVSRAILRESRRPVLVVHRDGGRDRVAAMTRHAGHRTGRERSESGSCGRGERRTSDRRRASPTSRSRRVPSQR